MRVSVIIACRDRGEEVVNAVSSVFEQDYEQKQVVVVDDGSAEDIGPAMKRLNEHAPCPVHCVRVEQPMGQSWCRNFAMQSVWDTSDAFAFLDADDNYLPGKISRSVEALSPKHRYGKLGLVYSDEVVTDATTGRRWRRFRESFSLDRIVRYNCVGGNFVVKKAVIESVGGFDESMKVAEDYDLARRAAEKFVLLHIPEPLVYVWVDNRCLTRSVPPAVWEHYNRMVARHDKTPA